MMRIIIQKKKIIKTNLNTLRNNKSLKLILKKLPIINIGSNFEYSIKQYALIIKNLVSDNIKLKFNKKFPDGTPRKLLNSSKIRKLGWKPKIDVITGLKSTIEWYEQNEKWWKILV